LTRIEPGADIAPLELLSWVASLPPDARDEAVERYLGIRRNDVSSASPGADLIGYYASGVAPVVRMLMEVPVGTTDVFVDLGAGLGKVVLLAHRLTGATARGVELQPDLVRHARQAADRLGWQVRFDQADARKADIDDGTVFFLYLPFTGPALAQVVTRLGDVARRHPIVVVSLGADLERCADWLVRRPDDSFWLTVYDSRADGVPPRAVRKPSPLFGRGARAIAFEQIAD
jgi:SAM-dependent methyltransferase